MAAVGLGPGIRGRRRGAATCTAAARCACARRAPCAVCERRRRASSACRARRRAPRAHLTGVPSVERRRRAPGGSRPLDLASRHALDPSGRARCLRAELSRSRSRVGLSPTVSASPASAPPPRPVRRSDASPGLPRAGRPRRFPAHTPHRRDTRGRRGATSARTSGASRHTLTLHMGACVPSLGID